MGEGAGGCRARQDRGPAARPCDGTIAFSAGADALQGGQRYRWSGRRAPLDRRAIRPIIPGNSAIQLAYRLHFERVPRRGSHIMVRWSFLFLSVSALAV